MLATTPTSPCGLVHCMTCQSEDTACCIPGCATCLPHRVAHWRCVQCGGGPYKFSDVDPGPYQKMRPYSERTQSKFVTTQVEVEVPALTAAGTVAQLPANPLAPSTFAPTPQMMVKTTQAVGRWHYAVRRICSAGCYHLERSHVANDEMETMKRRPDLADAILAKREAEEDLQTSLKGSMGPDDLGQF